MTLFTSFYHYSAGMNKAVLFLLIAVFILPCVVFASPAIIDDAEELLAREEYEKAITLLKGELENETSIEKQAELYTELSKCYLQKAEYLDNNGAAKNDVLALYQEGERMADKAVRLDPDSHLAYFWRGSNAGMWGKAKGVFAALDRVGDMRDDFVKTVELEPGFSFAWFSLGQMYRMVPGGIISFGNKDYAVSLGRKAVDTMEREAAENKIEGIRYDYYVQLAMSLQARNWNRRKRDTEQKGKTEIYNAAADVMEEGCYYEGSLSLSRKDDGEEAEELLKWVIRKLTALPGLTPPEQEYLELAMDTYDDLF